MQRQSKRLKSLILQWPLIIFFILFLIVPLIILISKSLLLDSGISIQLYLKLINDAEVKQIGRAHV